MVDTVELRKLSARHEVTPGELVDELELRGHAVTADARGRLVCSPEAAADLDASPPSTVEPLVPLAVLAADGHGAGGLGSAVDRLASELAEHVERNEFLALSVPLSVARGLYVERERAGAQQAAERQQQATERQQQATPVQLLRRALAAKPAARDGYSAHEVLMLADPRKRRESDQRLARTNELARGVETGGRYPQVSETTA